MATIQIFTNQAADGNSLEFSVNGKGIISANGTFGGGTMSLQSKLANSNDVFSNTGDSFTEDFTKEISTAKGMEYRLALLGATAPTINAFVEDNK